MNDFLVNIGLKDIDSKELIKEWQRKMRSEKRSIDRQIREIEREEKKLEVEIRKLAKKGGQDASVRIMAKEIVQSRKATTRLYQASTNCNSVVLQMKSMAAQANLGKIMKASTDTMKAMNQLLNTHETHKTMMEMSREMDKAGFLQEMMDDMMPGGTTEMEEGEIDNEVNKIIMEATMDKLNKAPTLLVKANKPITEEQEAEEEEEEEEEDSETAALEARLKNLS